MSVKRIVKHPKLQLVVKGKRQRVPVGTELTLSPEAAERLDAKGFTINPKAAEPVDLTRADEKALAQLDKRQKGLDKARENKKLSAEQIAALDAEQEAIDGARAELTA